MAMNMHADMAGCLVHLNRNEEALLILQDAEQRCRRVCGQGSPLYTTILRDYAVCLRHLSRQDEAIPLLEECLAT